MASATTVVIVGDDGAVGGALKFALEAEGFDVRLYDGAMTLLADGNLPDDGCIVVDYRMPEIDGLELIGMMKSRGLARPTIMITEHLSRDLRDRAALLGVERILEKPLLGGSLVDTIRSSLAGDGDLVRRD